MLSLFLAVAGLFVGPVLVSLPRWRALNAVLDSFALTSVGGLALFHLLPEALEHNGPMALLLVGLGLAIPRLLHGHNGLDPWFMLAGLVVHAFFESAAMGGHGSGHALAAAVVLHRLPVGLVLFMLFSEHARSKAVPWIAVSVLASATVAGFVAGNAAQDLLPASTQAILEALVAGMLLHVILDHHVHDEEEASDHVHAVATAQAHHAPHDHDPHHEGHGHGHGHGHHEGHTHHEEHGGQAHHGHADAHEHGAEALTGVPVALGAVAGVLTVVAILGADTGHGLHVATTLLALTWVCAPALVLAYAGAGVMHALFAARTPRWAERGALTQSLQGVAHGLRQPIAPCEVLPMYSSMVRRGVPGPVAWGFLVVAPALGLDAILLSLPLLGAPLTLVRLLATVVLAVAVGLLLGRGRPETVGGPLEPAVVGGNRLQAGFRFGWVDLVDHTLPWVILGLLVAAFAEPLFVHAWMQGLPDGVQVVLFGLLGIPLYICASGATPIAAVAILQGVGPGAALAFLLTGPATNPTAFGLLSTLHGRRIATAFTALVTGVAIGVGLLVNGLAIPGRPVSTIPEAWSLIPVVALVILGVLVFASLVRQGPRGMVGQITHPLYTS